MSNKYVYIVQFANMLINIWNHDKPKELEKILKHDLRAYSAKSNSTKPGELFWSEIYHQGNVRIDVFERAEDISVRIGLSLDRRLFIIVVNLSSEPNQRDRFLKTCLKNPDTGKKIRLLRLARRICPVMYASILAIWCSNFSNVKTLCIDGSV